MSSKASQSADPVPAAAGAGSSAGSAAASSRLRVTMGHLKPTEAAGKSVRVESFPTDRESVLKWNGWGYNNERFEIGADGTVVFKGSRYELSGTDMPLFRAYMETKGLDMSKHTPSQKTPPPVAAPILNSGFVAAIEAAGIQSSKAPNDRLFRSHGHTCEEIFALRYTRPGRIPDFVVWPENSEQVEKIVAAAVEHNVCVIPFGGGTTVTGALTCPEEEKRSIVSVDTSKMCQIKWIDDVNMVARVEAGVVGAHLEKSLKDLGFCTGHEPDSQEFSTLGGWIATRASGMKKNVYGNIEDIILAARIVTPSGTIEKTCQVPRMSCGPDINEFILGSEGILGIITEATIRIHRLPEVVEYGSIAFPNFSKGVACMKAICDAKCAPASIRLMDNEQFRFGHSLKPHAASIIAGVLDKLKSVYVTWIKGYNPEEMCVATLLFQGTKEEVEIQKTRVFGIAKKFEGLNGGAENGKRGYFLTFVIAYLRDLAFDYKYVAESFETSVPWSCVENLCRNTKDRIHAECKRLGVIHPPMASCRVTQTYHGGACIYFYYGFTYDGLKDPLGAFHAVEVAARDECLANGGSISHHHGVGKVRKQWVEETLTKPGVSMIRAVKEEIDPKNIFGNMNLIPS